MLRLFIPFVLGIFFTIQTNFYLSFFDYILFALIGLLLLTAISIRKYMLFHYEWVFGILLTLSVFLSGMQNTWYQNETNQAIHFSSVGRNDSTSLIAEIDGKPILKEKSVKAIVNISEIVVSNNQRVETQGHLLVYFKRSGLSEQLQSNDKLILYSKIDSVKSPKNPGEFDYQKLLKRKNILFQTYANDDKWTLLKRGSPFSFGRIFADVQAYIYKFFDNDNLSKPDKAMLGALILGYVDEIEPSTVQSFSNTGIIHVLSVSGMHVGLIFIVITYILKQIPNFKRKKLLDISISLAFLWVYALISGFSPCVVRASLMFSFVVVAKSIMRYNNIYNTLAASAFLILVFNPYILMNIGFQLSYLAIVGIVSLQPELDSLLSFKSKILTNIWSLITVSIAAQLFTFPLSMFYFHQFPNYFIITNLIVLPLTTVIMYLGILLLFVSPIHFIADLLAQLIGFFMKLMMLIINWVEQLPYSVAKNVPFSTFDLLVSMLVVTCIATWFYYKSKVLINIILGLTILWVSWSAFQEYKAINKTEMIVYSMKGRTAIDFINGKYHIIVSDDSLKNDDFIKKFYLQTYWMNCGLKQPEYIGFDAVKISKEIGLQAKNKLIQFNGIKLFLLNKDIDFELSEKQQLDYLLVMNNSWFDLEKIQAVFKLKKVLIDGSNSYKTINFVERKCKENNIPVENIARDGALILKINR